MSKKISFGIIVLNGGFFLKQVLETIYPFAHAICIAEGPVKWWYENGLEESVDDTMDIIRSFSDPKNKIRYTQGMYTEKTEQCRAWFDMVPTDTDYIVCNDADEVHTPENLELLIKYLETSDPTSIGFKSDSFYGGFDRIIGGFEREHSFKRVLKYIPGCHYRTHRQPTLSMIETDEDISQDIEGRDIHGNQFYAETGITMWHGSYVSPIGVRDKLRYYEGAVIAAGKCIPNYFNDVWLRWVENTSLRFDIEEQWNGVQEFIPSVRGESKTIEYPGTHPDIILRDMAYLKQRFSNELNIVKNGIRI